MMDTPDRSILIYSVPDDNSTMMIQYIHARRVLGCRGIKPVLAPDPPFYKEKGLMYFE